MAPAVPMIGRDAELQSLRDAFADSRAGRPRVVVVRGEAGIGKTRLLQEFLAEASGSTGGPPVVVATGQCIDIGEIGAPFTPIRRLLREIYRGVGDEAFRAAAATPMVIASLSALLPQLGSDQSEAAPRGADLMAEALEQTIEELSRDFHLVLVIEDLHWADAATIALLRTLSVTLRGEHVTVVMTYRSDDVGRGHPLRPLLADLERNRAVVPVEVGRLDAAATAALAGQLAGDLGGVLSGDDVSAVIARSDGVPFFVEELVALDGSDLPDTLRDLVLARYERTGDEARTVAGVLAAGGVRVGHDVLEAVAADVEPDALHRGLREALAANVLVADDDGYAFRHALIRETVHGELLPSERAALHGRFADVLAQRMSGAPELAAEVAEHRLQARDIPGAFDATVAAYSHAVTTAAAAAAVRLGERLLELWPQVTDAGARAGRTRTALTLEICDLWRDLGEAARGLRVARDALTWAGGEDAVDRAQLHRVAHVALSNLTRFSESVAEARAGIALVSGRSDPAAQSLHARLLAGIAAAPQSALAPGEDRRTLGLQAVELAERSGDDVALASAAMNYAWAATDVGDLEGALGSVRRVVGMSGAGDAMTLTATLFEIDVLVRLGRYREAIEAGRAGIDHATGLGLERGVGAMIAANVGEAMAAAGDTAGAVALLERMARQLSAMPPFRSFTFRIRAQALSWDDDLERALRLRDVAREFLDEVLEEDPEEQLGWAETDTEVALNRFEAERDAARRLALLEEAVERASLLGTGDFVHDSGLSRRILPGAARAVAEAERAGIDPAATAALRRHVETLRQSLVDDGPAEAYRALVAAEWARSTGGAADAWRVALDAMADGCFPQRYLRYAQYRLAESLVSDGERDEGTELLAVVARASRAGTASVARWARELAARAGIPLDDGDASPATVAAESPVSGLTPRELQVLALVAEGLTNPQIGERLFISPKTASVHVSAILAKIGAANRAEAAAQYTAAQAAEAS